MLLLLPAPATIVRLPIQYRARDSHGQPHLYGDDDKYQPRTKHKINEIPHGNSVYFHQYILTKSCACIFIGKNTYSTQISGIFLASSIFNRMLLQFSCIALKKASKMACETILFSLCTLHIQSVLFCYRNRIHTGSILSVTKKISRDLACTMTFLRFRDWIFSFCNNSNNKYK